MTQLQLQQPGQCMKAPFAFRPCRSAAPSRRSLRVRAAALDIPAHFSKVPTAHPRTRPHSVCAIARALQANRRRDPSCSPPPHPSPAVAGVSASSRGDAPVFWTFAREGSATVTSLLIVRHRSRQRAIWFSSKQRTQKRRPQAASCCPPQRSGNQPQVRPPPPIETAPVTCPQPR